MSDPTTPENGCSIAPYTGIKAGCYDNPIRICVNAKGQVTAIDTGEAPSGSCCAPSLIDADTFSFQSLSRSAGTQQVAFPTMTGLIEDGATVNVYPESVTPGVDVTVSGVVVNASDPFLGSLAFNIDVVDPGDDGGTFYFAAQNPCGCEQLIGRLILSNE